ncbi:MAG: IS3 family transposase [Candidatus Midichloriaceae bacterium]
MHSYLYNKVRTRLMLGRSFASRDVANSMIFEYIEAFYNSHRRHSLLNYYSPNNFEMLYCGLYKNVA